MPVLIHVTKIYGTKDAKITPMTADPPGGSAAYGSAIDVPGIKSALVTFGIVTKKLRGDSMPLDQDSYLDSVSVKFVYAKESLDVRSAAVGGTTTDSGTTPNQIAKWRLLGTDSLFPYYKFEAQANTVSLGLADSHLVLWKCKTSSFPQLGMVEEDYHPYEIDAEVFPRSADSFWVDELLMETAAAIV